MDLNDKQGSVFAPIFGVIADVLEDCKKEIQIALATTRPWSKATPNRFKPYRVNATGKTSDSLEVVPTIYGAQLQGRENFLEVERGNEGGNRPSPIDLMEWAQARGLHWDLDDADFFADKIADQGDSLFDDGGRESFVTDILERTEAKAFETVSKEMTEKNGVLKNISIYLNI